MAFPLRRKLFVLTVAVALGAGGCTSGSSPKSQGAPGVPGSPASAEATERYGASAPPSVEGITYQPDVVVVQGGGDAVRSVSGGGLVWTVAADAGGVDDLAVGKVMFLTSRGVGRIVSLEPDGDDVTVTLAPVQLTEVVRDGTLQVDTPVDLGDVNVQEIPDVSVLTEGGGAPENDIPEQGGGSGEPESPETTESAEPGGFAPAPVVRFAAPDKGRRLPPPAKSKVDLAMGDWSVGAALEEKKGLTVSLARRLNTNLKVGVDVTFGFSSLRLVANVAIAAGQIAGGTTTMLHGLDYVDVALQAGVANGAGDNQKIRLEIPAEILNKPVIVGGLPMVLNFKVKMFAETALSGKNSTLTAAGRWGLTGPLGVQSGSPVLPAFKVITSFMDSIGGIAIGPSGIVIGSEFKFMLGMGVPGAATGPYLKFRTTAGATNGSALGAPLARCTRADLVIKGGGGVGLSLGEDATAVLKKIIPGLPPFKADLEAELLGTIAERSQTLPNVPLCTAG